MSRRKFKMERFKEVIRLGDSGQSKSSIEEVAGVTRKTAGNYLKKIKDLGLSYEEVKNLSESEIKNLIYSKQGTKQKKVHPDWQWVYQEHQKKNVTLALLWEEFKGENPSGLNYQNFCQHFKDYRSRLKPSMRQVHRFGEKAFLDFAGHSIPIINPKTGEVNFAQIFVAVLGASNYTFAYAVKSQSLANWLKCNSLALEFFGGVPEILVPDNLKAAVIKACRYEPEKNKTFQEFAMHYEVAIMPTRARKPKDKAKVEVGVQIVERWILATLRNYTFFSIDELNEKIKELLEKLNSKVSKHLGESRKEIFDKHEKHLLKPLPENRYEYFEWKKARVNIDYHVELDKCYYSVPYQYLKEKVELCFNSTVVKIIKDNRVIAQHRKNYDKWTHSTLKEHMPKSHLEYISWTPERIISWAESVGPSTASLVEQMLKRKEHKEQAYRSCMGVISLKRKYDKERIEKASERVIKFGISTSPYQSIKSILKKGLDKSKLEEFSKTEIKTKAHEYNRGPKYFSDQKEGEKNDQ